MSDSPGEAHTHSQNIEQLQTALVSWYESDHRSFPWRDTDDPYAILVSEVMSQQTQLSRVVEPYRDFLDRWPTVGSLATDEQSAVVQFWSAHSLGYNNRAQYLHTAANQVIDEFNGEFPRDPDELESLMGVGPYTANAVASFAFNSGNAVIDTNVKRVLYRLFDVEDEDSVYAEQAQRLMPLNQSRVWNNAMMELGAVACQKQPRCDTAGCPWRGQCQAYRKGDFSAPDVQSQTAFEGSRRQMRGRVIATLGEYEELPLEKLGPRIRVDYANDGQYDREWLRNLVMDLADDGLVVIKTETKTGTDRVALR